METEKNSVSLIIPHSHSDEQLNILCEGIPLWNQYPKEILIIGSSKTKIILNNNFEKFCENNNIILKTIYGEELYPGQARNKGILLATNPILAFLDVSTLPTNEWLSSGLKLLEISKVNGVWGATKYLTNNNKQNIIRAATYGSLPLRTLPGSILYKEIFNTCGLLVESVRAGEDGDWMRRVGLHNLKMEESKEILSYIGLFEATYWNLIKKWYRNYLSSSKLSYIRTHKDWYFYALSIVAIVIAFNWNWLAAEKTIVTYSGSLYYIPHITKISVLIIIFIYVAARGFVIPLRKGTNLFFLLPMNFIKVIFLSILLDSVKILAFIKAKFTKNIA